MSPSIANFARFVVPPSVRLSVVVSRVIKVPLSVKGEVSAEAPLSATQVKPPLEES